MASFAGLKDWLRSLVYKPCSHLPDKGDFMDQMRSNVENLRAAFVTGD